MTASVRPASREAGLAFYAAPLLGAVLVFAPLIKGGNRPLPLLILELAAILLLVIAFVRRDFGQHLTRPMLAALAALAALPLLHLLLLPDVLWASLPGRDFYAAALGSIGAEPAHRALSLVPSNTEAAWLTLLVPLAVFVTAVAIPDRRLEQLVNLFLGLALFQAVIGLAQFGSGSLTVVLPADGPPVHNAYGTYPNYDHLAGFLEMALPIALALLVANIHGGGRAPSRSHRAPNLSLRVARLFASGIRFNQAALYAAAALGILLGLVFTRSRAGIAFAMLGIFLCVIAFARKVGGERSARLVTVFSVVGLALAVEIGLAPVLTRFTDQNVLTDARWSIFSGTLVGIGEFFPFGSGIGSYPTIFRRFQPGDVPLFVNHAHNDYLEWLFEGGLAAGILVLAVLFFYLRRWPQIWTGERWSSLRFMQVAAGISLLLMALHGLVDFNLHIPANAVFFAFLAGVFFHRTQSAPERAVEKQPRHREEPSFSPPPVPENVPNPFAE